MQTDDDRVPIVRARRNADIARLAREALARLAPTAVSTPQAVDVLRMLEFQVPKEFGWQLGVEDLAPTVLGYTDTKEKTIVLNTSIYAALKEKDPRARFTGIHELGHALLHGPELGGMGGRFIEGARRPEMAARGSIPGYCDPEVHANVFAAEFLMPEPAVRALHVQQGGLLLPMHIETAFGVSYTSACIRLERLKMA